MQTLVRPATADDLGACCSLIAAYEGGEPADWLARFAKHLANPDGYLSVAVTDGQVIGYGRVEHQLGNPMAAEPRLPDGYYLSGIVVSEPRRRRGVGAALCAARIDWVAARAGEVWYFTNRDNIASRALHQQVGFQELRAFSSPHLDGGWGVLGHRRTICS
ncbi:MAG TPA: GNAT family N-acetyltransferase [Mycobacteriales bacterium]|nr:GNAT family N-acetyltransferase [Mycobacteriales bacterium]